MDQLNMTWISFIKFLTDHKDSLPIIISILSLMVTLAIGITAYSINKDLYKKSMPSLYYDHVSYGYKIINKRDFYFFGNKIDTKPDYKGEQKLFIKVLLKNDGGSSVYWGLVFLKLDSFKNIFISKPILNLQKGEIIEVSFLIDKELVKQKNKRKEKSNKPSSTYPNLGVYVFFSDTLLNSYYLKIVKHNFMRPPNTPKRIHKYSLMKIMFKHIMIFVARRNKTTYENIFNSIQDINSDQDLYEKYQTEIRKDDSKKEDTE